MQNQLSEMIRRTTSGPSCSWVSVDLPGCVASGDVDAARDVDRVPIAEAGAVITRETIAEAFAARKVRTPASVTDAAVLVSAYAVSAMAARIVEAIADAIANDARTRAAFDAIAATYAAKEPEIAEQTTRASAEASALGSKLARDPLAVNLATGSAVMFACVAGSGREPSALVIAAHLIAARVLDSMAEDRAAAERLADEIRRAIDGEGEEGNQ